MNNEIKEVMTSYNLNPQRFNNIRCIIHPDQIINWVCLDNDRENTKLLCHNCLIKEKEDHHEHNNNIKRSFQLVEYKIFLKNLYTYCTLEDNDPERFSTEIVQCLEGAKQPDKLKLFLSSVGQIKQELKKEFTHDFTFKIDEFIKDIHLSIEKLKQTFLVFFEEQIDSLFSRETLAIKQFKERGCKMILSAAKIASSSQQQQSQQPQQQQQQQQQQQSQLKINMNNDEIKQIENLSQAISRLHSGKIELSYAREHSMKVFKNLLIDFEKKIITESQDAISKIINKNTPELRSSYQFLPKKLSDKSNINSSKPISFQYLHSNTGQINSINTKDLKQKRGSFSTISEVIASTTQTTTASVLSTATTGGQKQLDSKRQINIQNGQNYIQTPTQTTIIQQTPSMMNISSAAAILTPNLETFKKNTTSNNTFIIKPVSYMNNNQKREQFFTPKTKKASADNLFIQINHNQNNLINSVLELNNSPKNGYLVNNNNNNNNNNNMSNLNYTNALKTEQSNKVQLNNQFAVFNHQKSQSSNQYDNFLSIPNNNNNQNNPVNIINNNTNKQQQIQQQQQSQQPTQQGSSLFSSFSQTLRIKSTTSLQPTSQQQIQSNQLQTNSQQQPINNNEISQIINQQQQQQQKIQKTLQQNKFNKKSNTSRNQIDITSIDQQQPQQQDQLDIFDRGSSRYYISQPQQQQQNQQNQNQNNSKKNILPKSGSFLSPNEYIQEQTNNNHTRKNTSLQNNSQNHQTNKDINNYEIESDPMRISSKRSANTLQTYTNQVRSGISSTNSNNGVGSGGGNHIGQALLQQQQQNQQQQQQLQYNSSMGSRMKNNIVKNVLLTNTTKQLNTDNLKHCKEIIQEKPFKYNLLSIVRIPVQNNNNNNNSENNNNSSHQLSRSRRTSPESHSDNNPNRNSPSNSPPKDKDQNSSQNGLGSSGRIEDQSNFLLAQPDGYISLYNVCGRNINQVYRERTHVKLNSLAIGRTGNMFFTAGETSSKNSASIKLWIFHSHQRFSELVELKMADANIKKIFFIKEEYASRLNKLSFAIWTTTQIEIKDNINSNKSETQLQQSKEQQQKQQPTQQQQQQQFYTQNKLGIWNLEFAGNKFEGAKMFNVSNTELPINTINIILKDDEILAYTKDQLTLYTLMGNDYSSIQKKSQQKFINIVKQDTICCIRSYQQSKQTQKNYFVISQSGYIVTMNENLNIIQEKSIRDLNQKPIHLNDTNIFEQDCDLIENSRFLHFFKKDNNVLFVYDLENLRVIDEIQSYDELKNIYFYGQGYYLGFEQYYIRIWKPLPQKQEIIQSISNYNA